MEYLNIVPYNKCTGCGMCMNICPMKAISMDEDSDGFLYPYVDMDKCISCGQCENNCTVNNRFESRLEPKKAYSFYINDIERLKESASGGAAAALAEVIINNGGVVYACSYDNSFYDACFSKCDSVQEFCNYKSSIYFNTQPMDQIEVKNIIDSGRLCMAVGLPCQIAALRNFIGFNDKLLCVSLICGGVDTRTLHRKILDETLEQYPVEHISGVNYRFKKKDWNSSCLKISFKSGNYKLGGGAFHLDVLRKSCYECDYKIKNSFADLLIGDFWGSEMIGKEFYSKNGTSVVIALTDLGISWMNKTRKIGTLQEVTISDALRTNKAIVASRDVHPKRDQILKLLREKSLRDAQKDIMGKRYYIRRLKYKVKGMMPDYLVRSAKRLKRMLSI